MVPVLYWHLRSQHLKQGDWERQCLFSSYHWIHFSQQLTDRTSNHRTLHMGHVITPLECLRHREFVMRESQERAAQVQFRILLPCTPSVFVLICAVLPAAKRCVHLESDSLSFYKCYMRLKVWYKRNCILDLMRFAFISLLSLALELVEWTLVHSHDTNDADESISSETQSKRKKNEAKPSVLRKAFTSDSCRFIFYSVMPSHSANPKSFAHSSGFIFNFRLLLSNITTNWEPNRLRIH